MYNQKIPNETMAVLRIQMYQTIQMCGNCHKVLMIHPNKQLTKME